MADEVALVADGFGAHVMEEGAVLFELAKLGCAGAEDARPQAGEELCVEFFLGGGLVGDGAGETEEVGVDVVEEGEEGDGVFELGLDGFLEGGEEVVEEELDHALFALGVGQAEDGCCKAAEAGGVAVGVFEDGGGGEEVVDVVVGVGEGG